MAVLIEATLNEEKGAKNKVTEIAESSVNKKALQDYEMKFLFCLGW